MPQLPWTAIRDDFQFFTLLYTGAFIQALLFIIYPHRTIAFPALFMTAYLISKNLLVRWGIVRDPSLDRVQAGRTTAQIVAEDGTVSKNGCDKEIVVFMLGSCCNNVVHGRTFSAEVHKVNGMFTEMWKDLTANREKWGFIGKTATLISTDEQNTNTMAWISYWKSLDHLQAFSQGPAHIKGFNWYRKGLHPGIGLMHETYVVPAGNWETIYFNFVPFGLGQAKQPFQNAENEKKEETRAPFASGLIPASGPTWKTMKSRMKRATENTIYS